MRVALTFDAEAPGQAHHDPLGPARILDILWREEVKATFLVQGRWAESEPGTARRIAEDGHLIGSHSHYHAPLDLMTPEGVAEDLETAAKTIANLTGIDPVFFRAPNSRRSEVLDAYLADHGYTYVGWTQEASDWAPRWTPERLTERVLNHIEGDIEAETILLHTWPRCTHLALPFVLRGLKDRGATFVTADVLW